MAKKSLGKNRNTWRFLTHDLSIYGILVLLVSLVLYWRYPNIVVHPNFYGEDGSVYFQNVLNKGWLSGFATTFNGYFIFGLYILSGFGYVGNLLLGHGLLSLPTAFSLTAILFLASVISLPYLLFRNIFGRRMLLVVLFGALVPLPLSPHIVIGTIGNTKWAFLYLAFLLSLYRLFNYKVLSLTKTVLLDLVILISAYTNSVVYLLVPLLFLPYLKDIWQRRTKAKLSRVVLASFRDWRLISLVVMTLALLPQIAYIALHGIPAQPGYLDSAYQASKTIEIFINRTYLFGVTHLLNGYMGNLKSLLLFAFLAVVGIFRLRGRERIAFVAGVYIAGFASFLFVFNRPGVSEFFSGYKPGGSGPDQFFYEQTLIMYLPIVLAAYGFTRLIKNRLVASSLLIGFFAWITVSGLISNAVYGERWRNAGVYENYVGSFTDQALLACQSQSGPKIKVTVYPYPDGRFALYEPRQNVCNKQLNGYQLSFEDLKLQPDNNNYMEILRTRQFTQTFRSDQSNLNGIKLFISTFNNARRSGRYVLSIYDGSCKSLVRQASIPTALMDNTYYSAYFSPISNSKEKVYCFSLNPPSGKFDPVALQRSQPGAYTGGELKENGKVSTRDIVFQPLFSQKALR